MVMSRVPQITGTQIQELASVNSMVSCLTHLGDESSDVASAPRSKKARLNQSVGILRKNCCFIHNVQEKICQTHCDLFGSGCSNGETRFYT